jgi:hypothetical protein
LVRRFIGETRAEYAKHFSGKMKKEAVFFGDTRNCLYLCKQKSKVKRLRAKG